MQACQTIAMHDVGAGIYEPALQPAVGSAARCLGANFLLIPGNHCGSERILIFTDLRISFSFRDRPVADSCRRTAGYQRMGKVSLGFPSLCMLLQLCHDNKPAAGVMLAAVTRPLFASELTAHVIVYPVCHGVEGTSQGSLPVAIGGRGRMAVALNDTGASRYHVRSYRTLQSLLRA